MLRSITINSEKIKDKVKNDRMGLFIANEWKRLITPYTPRDMGTLESNIVVSPFSLWYRVPYANYIYNGVKYVDPQYKVGGFYSSNYGWWSRPGVKKAPTEIPLNYQKKNPYATAKWDVVADRAGQKNKLYQSINAALKSGRI